MRVMSARTLGNYRVGDGGIFLWLLVALCLLQ